ncbi:MAG: ATP-binding protein [Pseudomonadota bacterium]
MTEKPLIEEILRKVNDILPASNSLDWSTCLAAIWREGRFSSSLVPVSITADITLADLLHVDVQKGKLVQNTEQFLADMPANHVLLWGSRGTGKSSLVQALLAEYGPRGLRLVEINREDLASLPELVARLADSPQKFVVFCDDLSFEADDDSYKALKSALEGSVFKTARNVLFYATSNRRHLLPEYHSNNAQSGLVDGELHHGEAVEEKISLSDRFGLWLSFYPLKQDDYLTVVEHWVQQLSDSYGVPLAGQDDTHLVAMHREALQWSLARGVRNGRTAAYFARHWVGSAGTKQAMTQDD